MVSRKNANEELEGVEKEQVNGNSFYHKSKSAAFEREKVNKLTVIIFGHEVSSFINYLSFIDHFPCLRCDIVR